MKRFGKYLVRGLLGRGGMGTVYKASIPRTGKIVALKVCEPREALTDILGEEPVREQFMKEAVTMAGLRHPHIAEIWDLDEDHGRPYFVMEYFCNNLGTVIGETYEDSPCRPLSVEAALDYNRQALSALARLHHAGIIHMDVKPFNMMLTDDETVKVIDFGLSKLRGERLAGPDTVKIGTPFYTAPEQEADPDRADERSDLYSIGIVLFRMLTGRLPEGGTRVSALNPDLDGSWDDFMGRALHPDPEKRFPSAGEMLKGLDRLDARWQEKKAQTCALLQGDPSNEEAPGGGSLVLRPRPVKVGVKQAREFFQADALWRPRRPVAHAFRDQENGTILDETTHLLWEKGGTPYPGPWQEAHAHVNGLNRRCFAGYSDWRLPTVDELMSLFRADMSPGQFCLEPVFDPVQQRIWSADRKSYVAAWYADADMGFVWWQDFTCYFYARGVRTAA